MRPSGLVDGPRFRALECDWKILRDGSGIERHLCPECVEDREQNKKEEIKEKRAALKQEPCQ